MSSEVTRVGRRGTVVIPASLRREYKLNEGTLLVAEARPEGIMLRPAVALPIEKYTPEQKAEYLLNNAVTEEDIQWAEEEIRKMGIDPASVVGDRRV